MPATVEARTIGSSVEEPLAQHHAIVTGRDPVRSAGRGGDARRRHRRPDLPGDQKTDQRVPQSRGAERRERRDARELRHGRRPRGERGEERVEDRAGEVERVMREPRVSRERPVGARASQTAWSRGTPSQPPRPAEDPPLDEDVAPKKTGFVRVVSFSALERDPVAHRLEHARERRGDSEVAVVEVERELADEVEVVLRHLGGDLREVHRHPVRMQVLVHDVRQTTPAPSW